jgi:O-acetylhomoserine (thiol)-lyase
MFVKKITKGQASGIISFGIKGGMNAAIKFIDALQMILRVLSMGDAKSLACHPASTIHRQLTPEQLVLAGVSEDMIRISVGIEHIDDIIQDVEQAIQASMH